MLAQNFKTPADLRIEDAEFGAMLKVLGMLERGELHYKEGRQPDYDTDPFGFNMGDWCSKSKCGTVACIGGWVALFTDQIPQNYVYSARGQLKELYFPITPTGLMHKITTEQAAIALRNYLTHGEPRWAEALSA